MTGDSEPSRTVEPTRLASYARRPAPGRRERYEQQGRRSQVLVKPLAPLPPTAGAAP
ncbi:MAG: hypothetical protein K2X87_20890 [Gemmataceae bacterium]|nr:hypothetical protein [Gemmataceae bacterium]